MIRRRHPVCSGRVAFDRFLVESDLPAIRRLFVPRSAYGTCSFRPVRSLVRTLLSFGFLAVGVAACGGNDGVTGIATIVNTERTNSVFALSGTSPSLPAGYYFITESLVRPQLLTNGNVNFEIAFDLSPDGSVALIPARLIAPEAIRGTPAVGIQKSTVAYGEVVRAPDRNYVIDSTFTGQAGETFILQLYSSGCTFGYPFYAKVAIDSIIPSERRIVFRSMVNRNCGFRGLVAGLPTN